jgi:hypothetical protein
MGKSMRAASKIVALAIYETGQCDMDSVVEYIIQHYHAKVVSRGTARKCEVWSEVFKLLDRIGIETTGDVQRLIDETMRRAAG